MLSLLSSRGTRELVLISITLILFSCGASKPPAESIDKVAAVKFNLEIGEEFQFPNGDRIIGISKDSVLHVPKPSKAEPKPFINIQKYKDKSVDKSRENSDDITVKEKTAKVVDKSKDKSKVKDKSLTDSKNRHKEKSGGLPWWLWLLMIIAVLIWIFWKGIKAWIKTQFPFL